MKAPAFDYVRPRSLDEALALLRRHGDEAKILAGGQSLVPALNLRLLAPKLLVDIGGLAELKGIAVADGTVRIGALTRHVELMRAPEIARHLPLIAAAMPHLSHAAIRNRGTLGGNLAHADPASELPACCLALGARMTIAGPDGERELAAEEFFTGIFETALRPDEILTRVDIPAGRRGRALRLSRARAAQRRLRPRRGGGAGRGARRRASGVCASRSSPSGRPRCWPGAPQRRSRAGRSRTPRSPRRKARSPSDLAPQDDLQASAATRLHLARVLLRRAVHALVPGAAEKAA